MKSLDTNMRSYLLQVQLRDRKILKLVVVYPLYRKTHTPAAESDLLYDILEEIMYGGSECVIFEDFKFGDVDSTWLGHKDSSGPGQAISNLVDFAALCATQSSRQGAGAHKPEATRVTMSWIWFFVPRRGWFGFSEEC